MPTSKRTSPTTDVFILKPDKDESLLDGIYKLRTENRFIDIVIELDDNSTISAHRVVLAAFSEYFERLLGPNMKEGQEREPIKLRNVDKESFVEILDFAYNCDLKITIDNVYRLLETADYLMIKPVIEGCLRFLKSKLDAENCLTMLNFAAQYDIKELDTSVIRYIYQHFEDVRTKPDFPKMSYKTFYSMLREDNIVVAKSKLIVPSEMQECSILKSIFHYVSHNDHLTTMEVLNLFKTVSTGVVPKQHLEDMKKEYTKYLNSHKEVEQFVFDKAAQNKRTLRSYPKLYSFWESRALGIGGGRTDNNCVIVSKFDHSKDTGHCLKDDDYISGMDLAFISDYGQIVLAGLTVHYSNGYKETLGNIEVPDISSFRLEPNERVVRIEANVSREIHMLSFCTNTQRTIGPFGEPDVTAFLGTKHRVIEPDPDIYPQLARIGGYVMGSSYSRCKDSDGIARLKFYFQVYQLNEKEPDPRGEELTGFGIYGESDPELDPLELCSVDGSDDFSEIGEEDSFDDEGPDEDDSWEDTEDD